MSKFIAGTSEFQKNVYPENQELFEQLSKGQSPEALFITCSDSRIDTGMITQTQPGDIFICRNAGNIVPPHTDETSGMRASIEFSVAALNVPHIVVCGHTECGAMKGAMNPEGLDALPHVKQWVGYSKAAVAAVKAKGEGKSEAEQMQMLLEENVLLQLDHLKTHPTVAARLAKGDLQLHGWVYDIKTGAVTAYDEKTGAFAPLDERYAEEISNHLSSHRCVA